MNTSSISCSTVSNPSALALHPRHSKFRPSLEAEFSWAERTARSFMVVAERFGGKSAIIADLPIEPTAASLLAAPSVPEQASEVAIEGAEAGEQVTTAVAK